MSVYIQLKPRIQVGVGVYCRSNMKMITCLTCAKVGRNRQY